MATSNIMTIRLHLHRRRGAVYLQQTMILHVVASLPLDWILLAASRSRFLCLCSYSNTSLSEPTAAVAVRVVRLLRLESTVSKLFRNRQNFKSNAKLLSMKIVLVFVVLLHFVASAWIRVKNNQSSPVASATSEYLRRDASASPFRLIDVCLQRAHHVNTPAIGYRQLARRQRHERGDDLRHHCVFVRDVFYGIRLWRLLDVNH